MSTTTSTPDHHHDTTPPSSPPLTPPSGTQTSSTTTTTPTPPSSLWEISRSIDNKVSAFLAADPATLPPTLLETRKQVEISLDVISRALQKYGLEGMALSYNGGKDCLVLVILLLSALHRHYFAHIASSFDSNSAKIPADGPPCADLPDSVSISTVYVRSRDPFEEVEEFVASSSQRYHLNVTTYDLPIKAAFAHFIRTRPATKAIMVGIRRTDPFGSNLTHFDPTDHGWPEFMRVHPVVDWHYVDIWNFIRQLKIPYCSLYDRGYTSLGGRSDTIPNPDLKILTSPDRPISQHPPKYKPAYELRDELKERDSRGLAAPLGL